MAKVIDYARRIFYDWRSPSIVEKEIEAELQFHLDCKVDDLISEGWDPADARQEACRLLGNLGELKEQCAFERNALRHTVEDVLAVVFIPVILVFVLFSALVSLAVDPD